VFIRLQTDEAADVMFHDSLM